MGAELSAGYQCPVCGAHHAPLPLSASAKAPAAVAGVPAAEFAERVAITPDQCVIDQRTFFLRGRIVVPIHELDEPFIWGVWAEVSPRNFLRTTERWTVQGREVDPPFTGYLETAIPFYGDTRNLQVRVETQPVGRRPHFVVLDPQHPLAAEQRAGITLERVKQIAAAVLHAQADAPGVRQGMPAAR